MTATDLFDDMPDEPTAIHRWLGLDGRLDALRAAWTLSDLVARTVPLRPAEHGETRGQCPAHDHDDDDESFFVNDGQGVFHCFGCGIHGDVIRWMTDHEGVEYVTAMETLTGRAQPTSGEGEGS